MNNIVIKQVDYDYILKNIQIIKNITNKAFLSNHRITQEAYNKTAQIHKQAFIDLLNEYTTDSMEQIQRHQGLYFVAEAEGKIIGFTVGCPYGKKALSDKFMHNVFQSQSCFKEIMSGWWKLMEKYEGTPPGRIFHQATIAVDPEFAGKKIGERICDKTLEKIHELGYDGLAVETSSEPSDRLFAKMNRKFRFMDIENNGAGLTLRLHLRQNELSERIHQWFLAKQL